MISWNKSCNYNLYNGQIQAQSSAFAFSASCVVCYRKWLHDGTIADAIPTYPNKYISQLTVPDIHYFISISNKLTIRKYLVINEGCFTCYAKIFLKLISMVFQKFYFRCLHLSINFNILLHSGFGSKTVTSKIKIFF